MRYLLLIILFSISQFLHAQKLVKATVIETQSSASINIQLLLFGTSVRVDFDVELVSIEYETVGSDGMADVASGLIILPLEADHNVPLHAHFHGTTTRDAVPSVQSGGYELGLIYAGKGHCVFMPDYIGMGSSRGFHPYVHRETQASAGLDMAFATREYIASRDDITLSEDLTIAGYSQGGHGAMSFQQLIETEYMNDFNLLASTPMSGPYDLSGAFKDFVFNEEEYFFPQYLLYQVIGYNTVYGTLYDELSDFLKEPYVAPALKFEETGIGLGALGDTLINLLIANEGQSIPIKMFKNEYVEAFRNDDNHPFNVALRDNNTYNFTAHAPTRIIYCTADDQVPFMNSLTADSILNANGAVNTTSIDVDINANHGACVFPAVEESLKFIGEFTKSTSTYEILEKDIAVKVYPNPTDNHLDVTFENGQGELRGYVVFNLEARKLISETVKTNDQIKVDVSSLQSGTYVIQIITKEGSVFRKFVKA